MQSFKIKSNVWQGKGRRRENKEEADTEFRFAPEVAREGRIKGIDKVDPRQVV